MSQSAPISPLRQYLEDHVSRISAEVERMLAEGRERAFRDSADCLNQAVRRIRQAGSVDELGATLLDAAFGFASGAALFHIDGAIALGDLIRGVTGAAEEEFEKLEIPLSSAAALSAAIETRDPVIAAAAPGEISSEFADLIEPPDGRAFIFPVPVRDSVPALVCAWGGVQGSAIELLAQVAAAAWTELSRPPQPELVQIAAVASAPEPEPPATTPEPAVAETVGPEPPQPSRANTWDQLSPAEQQLHFRAQRFARVQVAEMRLHQAAAVQNGRARRDLYAALRQPIDSAREIFQRTYFPASPSMVDYLHLELVRTLANDDPDLLGKDYPGPMV